MSDLDLVTICGDTFRKLFDLMDNEATGATCRLYLAIAYSSVDGFYSNASSDPRLPDDDATLARIAYVSTRKFRSKIRPEIEPHFIVSGGFWRIKHWELIRFSRVVNRGAIPDAVKAVARNRHGGCCAYCGDTEGPFEHDHLIPASKGGTEDPSNIVLACAPCNRSKSDMTLREWMASTQNAEGRT